MIKVAALPLEKLGISLKIVPPLELSLLKPNVR
jgi:hypothetical protein